MNVETEQVEVRLDAVEIDDEPQHRDKKHQRKMLNRRLSDLNERLEAVNDSYAEMELSSSETCTPLIHRAVPLPCPSFKIQTTDVIQVKLRTDCCKVKRF